MYVMHGKQSMVATQPREGLNVINPFIYPCHSTPFGVGVALVYLSHGFRPCPQVSPVVIHIEARWASSINRIAASSSCSKASSTPRLVGSISLQQVFFIKRNTMFFQQFNQFIFKGYRFMVFFLIFHVFN